MDVNRVGPNVLLASLGKKFFFFLFFFLFVYFWKEVFCVCFGLFLNKKVFI